MSLEGVGFVCGWKMYAALLCGLIVVCGVLIGTGQGHDGYGCVCNAVCLPARRN